MIKSFQKTLHHLFIDRGHPIFKWIFSFRILPFIIFLIANLNILISVILIYNESIYNIATKFLC